VRDYEDMERELRDDAQNLDLPADRERLKLLQAEKERDLAAVLSAGDREQMELRTSPSAQALIKRYGDIIASEEEYKRLYALQKAFDDRYASPEYHTRPPTPEQDREREDAERQLNDALRAALGEERWARPASTHDREREVLAALTTRLNLPGDTTLNVFLAREVYAQHSLAIQRAPGLSDGERHEQLAQLGKDARASLQRTLGADGIEAYAQQASWLRSLTRGHAFTTDARQLPPGSPRPESGTTAYQMPVPHLPPPNPKR
jgi:hypothetical protein